MTTESGASSGRDISITFTDTARERVKGFMESRAKENSALRLGIQGRSGAGFRYAMNIVDPEDRDEDDIEIDAGGFTLLVDSRSAGDLNGVTIDFVERAEGSGFQIDNPNPVWSDPLAVRVQEVLDTRINPGVASHGGYIELDSVRENVAYVLLGGGCQGCGMASVTLKQGIEAMILEAVPEIIAVRDATDHSAGENPYYRPSKK